MEISSRQQDYMQTIILMMHWFLQLEVGTEYGGWYRVHDASPIVVGFEHSSFTFGYSYGMISSGLNDAKNTVKAHEITLSIKFSKEKKAKTNMNDVERENLKDAKLFSNPIMVF